MTRVYLHVGPVKTGSTFLQKLLWLNRENLAEQGYLLPHDHPNDMWFAANDLQSCAFVDFDLAEANGAWEQLVGRATKFDGSVIVSHEILGLSTPEHIAKVVWSFGDVALEVIVMARGLVDVLPSLWQEKVKMVDPDVSWPDFVAAEQASGSPWTDASRVCEQWTPHVTAENIHVVTVPQRPFALRALLERFADATGLDVGAWDVESVPRNESMDALQTELLRMVNHASARHLDRRGQRRLNNLTLLPRLGRPDPQRRLRVPLSMRPWIEEESNRRVNWLQTSGVSIHGDLQDLMPGPENLDAQGQDAVTDSELLREAVELLASLPPAEDAAGRDFV
ncbi:MAG TPA: hypothetical protein VMT88_10235 [Actinomycetes bacterium]|nr:hypothetical protein [Actinomycetes bacterium]